MKILHIAECGGGVARYLQMLMTRLRDYGIGQAFICSENYDPKDYTDMADEVYRADMTHSFSLGRFVRTVKQIRAIIRSYAPDIVYCHSSFAGAFGRPACWGMGVSVVYNPHGWSFDMRCNGMKRFVYRKIEWLLGKSTNQIVAISYAEKISAVSRRIAKSDKICVITNGIDFGIKARNDESYLRKSLNIPDGAYVVGMVGRISPQKAPDIFVRVAAEVIRYIPNAWFIIVGDGEDRNAIMLLAERLGIASRLVITGWVNNVLDYIDVFDQAVLLSRWEGFGLVLPEYAQARKPIVATDSGAIPDIIISGINGLLIGVDNVGQAVDAIRKFHDDLDLRNRCVEDGYMRARLCFNADRVAKQHVTLFEKLKLVNGGG